VLVEPKQWTAVAACDFDGCVETYLGGAPRRVLRNCRRALSYAEYLKDMNWAFDPGQNGIAIEPRAWLHNMHPGAAGELAAPKFADVLGRIPMYLSHDADRFKALFYETVGAGGGMAIMERALAGKHAPTRNLLEQTAAMLRGEPRYRFIDDQIVAFEAVFAIVRRAQKEKKRGKAVVVVTGGPGTGKSVDSLKRRDEARF